MNKKFFIITFTILSLSLFGISAYKSISNIKKTYINANKVEYVTQKGGMATRDSWVVLDAKKNKSSIEKVVNTINSYKNRRKALKEDLEFLKVRHGYPSNVYIKMKDGSEISIIKVFKIEKLENGYSANLAKDRTLMYFKKGNKQSYYLVNSIELVDYLLDGVNKDIPKRSAIKIPDKIIITFQYRLE